MFKSLSTSLFLVIAFPLLANATSFHAMSDLYTLECTKNGRTEMHFFDYLEAEYFHGHGPNLGTGGSATEQALVAIERFELASPERFKLYNQRLNNFNTLFNIDGRITFGNWVPQESLVYPSFCSLHLLGRFQTNPITNVSQYVIDGQLWGKLDRTQRAGAIIHALTYIEYENYNPQDSGNIRLFNAYLSSGLLPSSQAYTLNQFLNKLAFAWFEHDGHSFSQINYRTDKSLESGHLIGQQSFIIGDGQMMATGFARFYPDEGPHRLQYSDSQLMSLYGQSYQLLAAPEYNNIVVYNSDGSFTFQSYDNGIYSLCLVSSSSHHCEEI